MTPCALIYNRDGGLSNGGWVHIVPKGELPNAEAGVVQVLDDQALDSILANIDQERARLGENWPGIYMGVEHHVYDPSKSSEALGWAKQFKREGNGIWALPEWTDIGDEAIRNRRFKYTSFVTDPCSVEQLDGNRVRVLRIETVGLTNLPNGKNMLVPINNRSGSSAAPRPESRVTPIYTPATAARRIGELAQKVQRTSGIPLASAYVMVMNREKSLSAMALGRTTAGAGSTTAREALGDAAQFAGGLMLRLAQARKMPGLAASLNWVKNRFPRLTKMANRQAGWEALADLEPVARAAYLKMADINSRGAEALQGRWPGILSLTDGLQGEFPSLTPTELWAKLKEIYPATFLKFILSFDGQSGPDPAAQQNIDGRAVISVAADKEFRESGRQGPRLSDLSNTIIPEAMEYL